jgi:hypothetical protein
MNSLLKTGIICLILVLSSVRSYAQLKVYPQNKVIVGCSWCTTANENFAVHGDSYFIQSPAQSGISIKSTNWNGTFNTMGIIPQWGNSSVIGETGVSYFAIHGTNIYYQNLISLSDRKFKTNINKIASQSALQMVLKLNGYTYDFTVDAYPNTPKEMLPVLLEGGKNQIGLIAQEVKEVLPELVKTNEKTGDLSVNYIGLIPVLLESIKEQQLQIEELKKQIAELKKP